MTIYTPSDLYDDVDLYDTSDLVIGGTNGKSNIPIKELANRTEWLKNRTGKYKEVVHITGSQTIDKSYMHKLIAVEASSNITISIDNITTFPNGAVLSFCTKCITGKSITIQTTLGQAMFLGPTLKTKVFLHDAEFLKLVIDISWIEIEACSDALISVGDCVDGYKVRRNTAPRHGQLLNRLDYPRIWEWAVNNLADGQELIDEALWFFDQYTYRGCFTKGDGSTTFRMPDDRAMHTRYLDSGRGVDFNRSHSYAGGYESDGVGAHNHVVPILAVQHTSSASTIGVTDGPGNANKNFTSNTNTGATNENLVKNTAKIPLIKI